MISKFFWPFLILFKGTYLWWLSWFLNTACLWLKVPLPESCPDSLTEKPSTKRVPNANVSADDQSIFLPLSIDFFFKSNIFFNVLWTEKSDGIVEIFFPTSLSKLVSTPLNPLLSLPKPGLNLDHTPSNHFNSDL